tara:strand:- start:2048 stop:2806 length:759 start_codon:yes stop_codon:yes gene_type:complete
VPEVPDQTARLTPSRAAARWVELLLLYVVLPAVLAAAVDRHGRFHAFMHACGLGWFVDYAAVPGRIVFPVLLGTTALIVAVLLFDRSFDRSQLWGWSRARAELPRVLIFWSVGAIGLLGLTAFIAFRTDLLPEAGFMRLPRERPEILLIIWLAYPWVSAYPQEITHRVFFWHRYAVLFPNRWVMLLVNALVFAWMHALFWNLIALAMTFAGGLLFAWTYDRTRSALAAGVEHGLYGAWCFTVGLGWFVFAGR